MGVLALGVVEAKSLRPIGTRAAMPETVLRDDVRWRAEVPGDAPCAASSSAAAARFADASGLRAAADSRGDGRSDRASLARRQRRSAGTTFVPSGGRCRRRTPTRGACSRAHARHGTSNESHMKLVCDSSVHECERGSFARSRESSVHCEKMHESYALSACLPVLECVRSSTALPDFA